MNELLLTDLSYTEGKSDKIDKLRKYIPWINLSVDEIEPFTVVMNMRFYTLLMKCKRLSLDTWDVPSDIAKYAKRTWELHNVIESRFSNIDWSGYISRYGIDARNFSNPPAVRNYPVLKDGNSFDSVFSSEEMQVLKAELAEKNKKIEQQEKRIRTLTNQYLVLQNQYNELSQKAKL